MEIRNTILFVAVTIFFASCGNRDKKQNSSEKETTVKKEANFNSEVDAAPGNIITELIYTEKNGKDEKNGKQITKYFEDSSKVIVTIFKKTGETVYDANIYTINKADAKKLKADLTPMNDGSDSYTTYSPKDFGAVSLVFVDEKGPDPINIISNRSMRLMSGQKSDETSKENGLSMPVPDFKTAEEWVKKLMVSFKK